MFSAVEFNTGFGLPQIPSDQPDLSIDLDTCNK